MLNNTSLPSSFAKISALLLLVTGGFFAAYTFIFGSAYYPNIVPAAFLDAVAIPLDWVNLGTLSFPIQVDNFLVFQEFHSLPPGFTLAESYLFGGIIFLISVSVLALFSTFKKVPFLLAGAAWIILLTLANSNGLNIGSPSSNTPLIVLISGTILPVIYFHVWRTNTAFGLRWVLVFLSSGAAIFALIRLSPIANPALYLSEQSLVIGLGMAIAWIFWQGHGVVSGIYLLLARANRNVSMKISIQFLGISGLYLLTLVFLLLDLKGDANLPFPTFSPLYLIFPTGILGWISTTAKIDQVPEIAAFPAFLKALFLLGFGVTFWVIWKLEISGNQAAEEFLKHLIVYSQFGFSLFFMVYILSNFLSVMDSGKSVDKILFKPYSLPYYHLRIGGLISILVVTIYMDAVLAPQVNSMTTSILGDYYYQTGQKLEASILYENSWAAFRKNQKAKNATAQLLFDLNQPTLAKQHLDQSFSEVPQVDNIILQSSRMIRENKPFEAVYYLENGLRRFPENPFLINNLALLYVKIQKPEEALKLLSSHGSDNPILSSNLIALQSKLQKDGQDTQLGNELIFKINRTASNNLQGIVNPTSELKRLREQLEKETSPMLLNAGLRNLFSLKNFSSTAEELVWLDSVSRQENMLEYLMQVQETASIRSLAAGRVNESVKNLNGLAFRNPGDAGYYLNLTAGILAQNLDFEKASKDLIVAEEKGFKAFRPHHLIILQLGGFEAKAAEFKEKFQIPGQSTTDEFLIILSKFNQSIPDKLFDQWKGISSPEWKGTFAFLLLERKAHGLTKFQLNELGNFLKGKVENEDKLAAFLQNPDWSNQASLLSFTEFLQVGEELNSNPYKTPLILCAADRMKDPLDQYELLNSATEFNKDPMLWIRKVQAAKRIGLDNYATSALQEMSSWLTWDEIELLQGTNY
jgi:tetratricopeptide (TPR) repeat protein